MRTLREIAAPGALQRDPALATVSTRIDAGARLREQW
jgi:hypothetical protein